MLKISTKEEVAVCSFTQEQLKHLHFLLQPYWVPLNYEGEVPEWMNEDYYSFISFAYKDPTDTEKPFHGYAGFCKSDDTDSGFDRFYEPVPAVDLYCCPNGFKAWNSRAKDKLISLQTIVIDIDAHDSDLSVEDLQAHIKDFVPKLLDNVFFEPNFISYTGRGVHFWYCVEPCHVSCMCNFESCISGLLSCYKAAIQSIGESVLSLDEGASKRPSGLYRVPYSYNSKTCTWATGELLHYDRINVDVLLGALQSLGFCKVVEYKHYDIAKGEKEEKKKAKSTPKKKTKKRPGLKYKDVGQYRGAFIHRKAFVEHLLDTRETLIGKRSALLYMLFHAVYNLVDTFEEAQDYIQAVNASLPEPITEAEVKAIAKYVYNHNHKLTNEGFLKMCGATPDEVIYFNRSTEKQKKKAAAAKKKMDRDSIIFDLWDSGERNIAYIAKMAGCSRDTVYRVSSQIRF